MTFSLEAVLGSYWFYSCNTYRCIIAAVVFLDLDANEFFSCIERTLGGVVEVVIVRLKKQSKNSFLAKAILAAPLQSMYTSSIMNFRFLTFVIFYHVDAGCVPNITERLFKSHRQGTEMIENIFETLCANIYKQVTRKELLFEIQQKSRDPGDKDLYMEQCYVCGILGYQKLLSLERLSVILGWQLPHGCYGNDKYSQEDQEKENRDDEKDWDYSELPDKR